MSEQVKTNINIQGNDILGNLFNELKQLPYEAQLQAAIYINGFVTHSKISRNDKVS